MLMVKNGKMTNIGLNNNFGSNSSRSELHKQKRMDYEESIYQRSHQ